MKNKLRTNIFFIALFSCTVCLGKKVLSTDSCQNCVSVESRQRAMGEFSSLKEESERRMIAIVVVAIVSVIMMTKLFLNSEASRRKRQDLELQVYTLKQIERESFERSDRFIEQNKEKLSQLEEQLKTSQSLNEEMASVIEKQRKELLFANEKALKEQQRKDDANHSLVSSEAHALVEQKLRAGKLLLKTDWEEIKSNIDRVIEDFKIRLFCIYRMSEQEYHICILVRMGFSTSEIAQLIGRSVGAVSLARKRLYFKMFGKDGSPKEFDEFVNSL